MKSTTTRCRRYSSKGVGLSLGRGLSVFPFTQLTLTINLSLGRGLSVFPLTQLTLTVTELFVGIAFLIKARGERNNRVLIKYHIRWR